MASNSSAAAMAAMFGIRDGHQQDQIKPLLAQQHCPPVAAPPSALAAVPDQAAEPVPPVKKKRTMPGKRRSKFPFFCNSVHACIASSNCPCLDLLRVELRCNPPPISELHMVSPYVDLTLCGLCFSIQKFSIRNRKSVLLKGNPRFVFTGFLWHENGPMCSSAPILSLFLVQ
jgi:hypothetical protein